jgi:uncharacterized protein
MIKTIVHHGRSLARRLFELRDTPASLAGGVAIGVLVGLTPLFGLKTALCLGLAIALRCNPVAAVVAVSLSDVLTPVWPLLGDLQFHLGAWFLGLFGARFEGDVPTAFHFGDLLRWQTFVGFGVPMLAGSLVFAVPGALVAYAGMLPVFRRRAASRGAGEDGP